MDDEAGGAGLSGFAWYQFGQMSADSAAKTRAAVREVFSPRRAQVNVDQVLAQNRDLAAENARLHHSLVEYKLNYDELRRWSDGAEETIIRLRKERG